MLPAARHELDAPDAASRAAPAKSLPEDPDHRRSFLRMVSHELRTPLNSILGFSEILSSELYGPLGDPQYKEYAEIIRGSGQKLLRIVNQVLEIARLETGVSDLSQQPEPLALAVDDVLDAVWTDAEQRGVRITVSDCDGVNVMADPRGLRTVLTNLLNNAVAFSPEGGEVRLSAAVQRDLVEIAIVNDGDGLEPDDLPRLLKPFEQGENALTRHSEGAGLGLPICALTCQAMGGMLTLNSAPGRGFSSHVILRAA
jgi:signal transduction histidine kinase